MTNKQHAAILEAIRKQTEAMCESKETALKALVDMGVSNPDGTLTRTYGGEYTTLDEHRVPDDAIQPFADVARGLPLHGGHGIAGAVAADQQVAADLPRQGPTGEATHLVGPEQDRGPDVVPDTAPLTDKAVEDINRSGAAISTVLAADGPGSLSDAAVADPDARDAAVYVALVEDVEDPMEESGAEAGYEFWNVGKWADATAYDKAVWRGVSGTILDAARATELREALVEVRILADAGALRDVAADENFSDSRQMAMVRAALA